MDKFELVSKYKPCGDQPQAIESLANGVLDGLKTQVFAWRDRFWKNFHNGKYYSKSTKTNTSFGT